MSSFLDRELEEVTKNPNHIINKDKIKEQMLRMADMVNNKMNILQSNHCITAEQRTQFVGKFNLVFNQALKEFNIGPLTLEDVQWLQNRSARQNIPRQEISENIQPQIQKQGLDIEQDTSTLDKSEESDFQGPIRQSETEFPEGVKINEFGEVVRPDGQDNNFRISSDIPTFEPPAEQSLSFKQKIASRLQNNQLLMKVPFIRNFAQKQLNVLPPPTQEYKVQIATNSRTAFVNYISNNGKYRNLPPIQRMSDPEKIEGQRTNEEEERQ